MWYKQVILNNVYTAYVAQRQFVYADLGSYVTGTIQFQTTLRPLY